PAAGLLNSAPHSLFQQTAQGVGLCSPIGSANLLYGPEHVIEARDCADQREFVCLDRGKGRRRGQTKGPDQIGRCSPSLLGQQVSLGLTSIPFSLSLTSVPFMPIDLGRLEVTGRREDLWPRLITVRNDLDRLQPALVRPEREF